MRALLHTTQDCSVEKLKAKPVQRRWSHVQARILSSIAKGVSYDLKQSTRRRLIATRCRRCNVVREIYLPPDGMGGTPLRVCSSCDEEFSAFGYEADMPRPAYECITIGRGNRLFMTRHNLAVKGTIMVPTREECQTYRCQERHLIGIAFSNAGSLAMPARLPCSRAYGGP